VIICNIIVIPKKTYENQKCQEIKRHKERKEKKNKKCGDWCEDPVKREKERCSGSY
jgi:hypothetical protein